MAFHDLDSEIIESRRINAPKTAQGRGCAIAGEKGILFLAPKTIIAN
jgi:hypothetical protein